MNDNSKHSTRIAIISAAVSFFLSVVFAAFFIGQRTGKVLELDTWKRETAPRIERMDLEGSVATKNFITNYDKEQTKQYKQLDELQKQINHLESMNLRLDRLEQIVIDGQPKRERNP